MVEFEGTVRDTSGKIKTGRITSVSLIPFIGKKVKVVIEVVE